MQLTKERTLLIAILSIAFIALAADQLFLDSGPTQAAATEPAAELLVDEATSLKRTEPISIRSHSVARLLNNARQSSFFTAGEIDDAFEPSGLWGSQTGGSLVNAPSPGRNNSTETAIERFRANHSITGVIMSEGGQGGFALIDGEAVKVGDEIDGLRLISVDNNTAAFEITGDQQAVTPVPRKRSGLNGTVKKLRANRRQMPDAPMQGPGSR